MAISFPTRSKRPPQRLAMFEQWAARFPNTNSQISNSIKSLVDGYKVFTQQVRKISGDTTMTDGGRTVKSARAARAILPLMEALEKATEAATDHAKQLEAVMAQAYDPPNPTYQTCMRHAEIRAHFKAMPNAERLRLLEQARASGDRDTVIAVASTQAYLSGVPDQLHQHYRDQLVQAHAPEQAAVAKSLREQVSWGGKFRDEMLQAIADTVDLTKAAEIEAAAREDWAA